MVRRDVVCGGGTATRPPTVDSSSGRGCWWHHVTEVPLLTPEGTDDHDSRRLGWASARSPARPRSRSATGTRAPGRPPFAPPFPPPWSEPPRALPPTYHLPPSPPRPPPPRASRHVFRRRRWAGLCGGLVVGRQQPDAEVGVGRRAAPSLRPRRQVLRRGAGARAQPAEAGAGRCASSGGGAGPRSQPASRAGPHPRAPPSPLTSPPRAPPPLPAAPDLALLQPVLVLQVLVPPGAQLSFELRRAQRFLARAAGTAPLPPPPHLTHPPLARAASPTPPGAAAAAWRSPPRSRRRRRRRCTRRCPSAGAPCAAAPGSTSLSTWKRWCPSSLAARG